MLGNLNEIDVRSILQLIELGQRTGELFVETYAREAPLQQQSWFVFFFNGQIVYATEGRNNLARLRDYLKRCKAEEALNSIESSSITSGRPLEYAYLWILLEKKIVTPEQVRSIIRSIISETLFDLLVIHQGSFAFELASGLEPRLIALEIAPLVAEAIAQVQEWKQLHPYIHSPHQCPVILERSEIDLLSLPDKTLNALKALRLWADGTTSIRQISRYLNRDLIGIARAIFSLVQQGLVHLSYSQPLPSPKRNIPKVPRIVCIDDDNTVCRAIESILNQQGYEAASISNPLKALALILSTQARSHSLRYRHARTRWI